MITAEISESASLESMIQQKATRMIFCVNSDAYILCRQKVTFPAVNVKMSERENEEAEPVFQAAQFEIHTDDEVPDFSDKGCAWLWTWCIGPIVKDFID